MSFEFIGVQCGGYTFPTSNAYALLWPFVIKILIYYLNFDMQVRLFWLWSLYRQGRLSVMVDTCVTFCDSLF